MLRQAISPRFAISTLFNIISTRFYSWLQQLVSNSQDAFQEKRLSLLGLRLIHVFQQYGVLFRPPTLDLKVHWLRREPVVSQQLQQQGCYWLKYLLVLEPFVQPAQVQQTPHAPSHTWQQRQH